jgi:hypothetical protein
MLEQVSAVVTLQTYVREVPSSKTVLATLYTNKRFVVFLSLFRRMLGSSPESRTQHPSSKSFPTQHS